MVFLVEQLRDMTFTPLPRWTWTTNEPPGR